MPTLVLIGQFLRLPLFVTTATSSLVGVFWGTETPGPSEIARGLAYAFGVHLFSALQNDLADIAVDRTSVRRSVMPLPSGRLSPRCAQILMFGGGVLAVLVPVLAKSLPAVCVTFITLAAFSYYNLLGRNRGHPLLSDFVCGSAYTLPVLAVALLSDRPSGRPAESFHGDLLAWMLGFTVLVGLYTGYFGGVRDYANDRAHGRLTTAGWIFGESATFNADRMGAFRAFGLICYGLALTLLVGASCGIEHRVAGTGHQAVAAAFGLSLLSFGVVTAGLRGFPTDDVRRTARLTAIALPSSYAAAMSAIYAFGHRQPFLAATTVLVAASLLSPSGRGSGERGFGRAVGPLP